MTHHGSPKSSPPPQRGQDLGQDPRSLGPDGGED